MKKHDPQPGTPEYYTDPRKPLWPHFVGMLLPLSACGIGLWCGIASIYAGIGAEATEGVVVQMKTQRDSDNTTYEMPVVGYRVDGREYRCDGSVWWSLSAYRVGDRVSILYQIENPGSAIINNFWERWLMAIIFLALGLTFEGYCIRVLLQHVRNKRAAAQKKKPKDSAAT